MKNKLMDLNNHLFAELERLGDEDLKDEDLKTEIHRAEAIAKVSSSIIANANLQYQACKLQIEYGKDVKLGGLLEVKE